ncbi:MAG: hypothetical protein PHF21_04325 [Bacilli bacterium]|nr:hypothetical protein [Bacilli bacterium]
MYILNTALGAIMLLGSLISIAIFGADSLDAYLQIPNLTENLTSNGPLVMCVFCALTCTTHSSISLEGKNIWILKHIPVSIKEIFFAKIMVNLTILIPTILISSFALIYLLKLPFISIFALIIIPSIFALFIAGVGLLINLTYPVLNWVNEIKVIKQSMAAFLSLIVGGSVSFIPLILINKFNINIWIIGGLYLIITILVYKVLFTKGKNLFYKL